MLRVQWTVDIVSVCSSGCSSSSISLLTVPTIQRRDILHSRLHSSVPSTKPPSSSPRTATTMVSSRTLSSSSPMIPLTPAAACDSVDIFVPPNAPRSRRGETMFFPIYDNDDNNNNSSLDDPLSHLLLPGLNDDTEVARTTAPGANTSIRLRPRISSSYLEFAAAHPFYLPVQSSDDDNDDGIFAPAFEQQPPPLVVAPPPASLEQQSMVTTTTTATVPSSTTTTTCCTSRSCDWQTNDPKDDGSCSAVASASPKQYAPRLRKATALAA